MDRRNSAIARLQQYRDNLKQILVFPLDIEELRQCILIHVAFDQDDATREAVGSR